MGRNGHEQTIEKLFGNTVVLSIAGVASTSINAIIPGSTLTDDETLSVCDALLPH